MSANQIIGIIIALIGVSFCLLGTFIIYRYKSFYLQASSTSVIDSTGFLLVIIGIVVYQGITMLSLKIILLLIFVIILNPLSNHYIVKGAYRSGFSEAKREMEDIQ